MNRELQREVMVRIDDSAGDAFPGLVECSLIDAAGILHRFVEKAPVVTSASIGPQSAFPLPGYLRCTVLARSTDKLGRQLVEIDTGTPDGIASTLGHAQFVVQAGQLKPA